MRRFTQILVVVALLFFALLLAKNLIVKTALEKVFGEVTEFTLTVRDVKVGVFRPVVDVTGLKLTNPPDFPEPEALEIEKMFVHYDVFSLFTDKIHFKEVILDIPRVVMITSQSGESNMERLQDAASSEAKKQQAGTSADPEGRAETPAPKPESTSDTPPKTKAAKKPAPDVSIDKLTFRLGEVRIRDYSRARDGEEPRSMTIQLHVDRTYTDLDGVKAIGARIGAEVAAHTVAFYIKDVGKQLKEGGDEEKIEAFFKNLGDMFKGKKR